MADNSVNKPDKEIDLLVLFQKTGKAIGNLFLNLFKVILFIMVFSIRRIHFLILFIIIGGLIGFAFYKSTKRYYSSYMIAQANGINSADMITYINDLHRLCVKRNTAALSIDLQLPDSTAQRIKDIQAFFIIDANGDGIGDYVDFDNKINIRDTTYKRLDDRLHVSVEVYENYVFQKVKNGLLRYMRKNPYIIKLNEIRRKELQGLIAQIDREIIKLDSLQNTDYFKKTNHLPVESSQMMFISEKEPIMYYPHKIHLMNRKLEFMKELELATDAFTVIKDFTSLAFEENPKGKYIVKYSIICLIFGFLILLIIRFKTQLKKLIV